MHNTGELSDEYFGHHFVPLLECGALIAGLDSCHHCCLNSVGGYRCPHLSLVCAAWATSMPAEFATERTNVHR